MRESILLATAFEAEQLRKRFYASSAQLSFHTAWVKSDGSPMSAFLPLMSDVSSPCAPKRTPVKRRAGSSWVAREARTHRGEPL